MTNGSKVELDATDRRILRELQADARLSHVELGRRVHLSAPATARRVERLERLGVILGYRAVVDAGRIGTGIDAVVRFRSHNGRLEEALRLISTLPQVRECLLITGPDCALVKLSVASVAELGSITDRLQPFGITETSLVLSAPVEWRPLRVEVP